MPKPNSQFSKLPEIYIFPHVERKILTASRKLYNLGVGDIKRPLLSPVTDAFIDAIQKMRREPIGYQDELGRLELREAIVKQHYPDSNFSPDDVIVTDGINHFATTVLEVFDDGALVAVPDPAYPAFHDSALLSGKKGPFLLPCNEETGYLPRPPKERVDIIFLISPMNPTGVAFTREGLKEWVDYALERDALILFDGAYEAFIREDNIPHSIYEIEGAEKVAIEMRSFSKSHGFTGLRCGYSIVPMEPWKSLIRRFLSFKCNGVAYPIQKAALAAILDEPIGWVDRYLDSAKIIREGLDRMGSEYVGGVNSPYIWWKIPDDRKSLEFFDDLLDKTGIITIPGCGFGESGDHYLRLSGFTTDAKSAMEILKELPLCAI